MKQRSAPGLFITGTDTGVGKTFVTAAIARALRLQGYRVRACKPVATGAAQTEQGLLAEDTLALAAAAAETDLRAVTPWAFAVPAAPPVAARLAGTTLTLGDLIGAVRRREAPDSVLLVEGIGGLLCPLTDHETVADLIAALALPVLVVARRSLGTLNQTLLTLEVALARNFDVRGVIVSETEPVRDVAAQTNVAELRRRIDVPLLAVVSHQREPRIEDIAEVQAVDWWSIAAGDTIVRARTETEGRGACRQ
jgi:dethiobiotin synthetase